MSVPPGTVDDIRFDLGDERAIVAGESEGVSVAVQIDGTPRIEDRDLPDVLAELGRELGHYTAVTGWVAINHELPIIVSDGNDIEGMEGDRYDWLDFGNLVDLIARGKQKSRRQNNDISSRY